MGHQDVEDTGDGGAVLHFGQQSDDLAARLAAVVVHLYTPPPVVDDARNLPALSPTMEVSCVAALPDACLGALSSHGSSGRATVSGGCEMWDSPQPSPTCGWQAKLVRAALEDALAALKQHHPGELTRLHVYC